VAAQFNWWTDVIVPFGAALIGGSFALLGAWRGAKWAADEQRKHADEIASDRRRDELQHKVLMEVDEILVQLEYHARSMEEQWASKPDSMWANWNTELTRHLRQLENHWPAFRLRVRAKSVHDAFERFDVGYKITAIDAAQEDFNQRSQNPDVQKARQRARDVNREVLEETRVLRAALNEAL
jgi:hypothetical protein